MTRRFRLVDVFGERTLAGNPLAVVVDSDGLSTEEMLEITRWLGFSETTFLELPESDEADYKVRIFTVGGELPFAGHPTLGSCHVWQSLNGTNGDEIVQECGAGLVRLRRSESGYAFAAPPLIRDGPVEEGYLQNVASVLGVVTEGIVASRWVDNGPGWVGVMLPSAEDVLTLKPDISQNANDEQLDIGVVGMHEAGYEAVYEVRAFFSDDRGGMVEDPVTGSLNASLAQWLVGEGQVTPPYVVSQGTALGRSGRVHVSADDSDSIWIGGQVWDVVSGTI